MTKTLAPAFDYGNDASQWLVFIGATTASALGQIRSLVWNVAKTMENTVRVSDSATYHTATGIDVTGTLEIWQDSDDAEVTTFFDVANDVDATLLTVIAVFHDKESTDGSAVTTYTFTNFDVSSAEGGPREGTSQGYWSFGFVADSVASS